jgi:hypothetical protein
VYCILSGRVEITTTAADPPVALALLSSLSRLVVAQNGLVDMLFLDLRGR